MPSPTFRTLAASQFQARTDNLAQDAGDRFIFETDSRALWYDRDGIGPAGAVVVAILDGFAPVTAADILVIA